MKNTAFNAIASLMTKLARFVLAMIAVAALALPAHADKSDIAIGIGPDWGTSGHAIVASKKGFFEEEGLNVELKKFPAGLVQVEALAAGSLDFAVPAQAPVFSLRSAGIPILILANTAVWGEAMGLVGGKDAGILNPGDLAGKKIGLLKGSTAELMFNSILDAYGVDPSSVETVSLRPPAQMSSLSTGTIDGVVVWEPWVSNLMAETGGVKLHTGGTSYFEGNNGEAKVVDWTRTVLTTLEGTAKDHPGTVDAVLRAYVKAQAFITDPANKDEVVAIFSEFQEQEAGFNSKLFDSFEFSLALDDRFLDGMNIPLGYLEDIGRIKEKINVLDYVHTAPLAAADASSVSLTGGYSN